MLGIIAGTVFLEEPLFENMSRGAVETCFGNTTVFQTERAIYLPRHGADPDHYILPHRINHPANIQALKTLGVSGVISVCSTGSLKRELPPGHIVIPHDFISLSPTPTVYHDRNVHVPPIFDENLRRKLIAESEPFADERLLKSGIYWHTTGPRFETKAEIDMMANFADIVGMTLAGESVICCELCVPCAAICSVDNYAHGIGDEPLSAEAVRESARANAAVIADILRKMVG